MTADRIREIKAAMVALIGDEYIAVDLAKLLPVWNDTDRKAIDAIAWISGVMTDGGMLVRFG